MEPGVDHDGDREGQSNCEKNIFKVRFSNVLYIKYVEKYDRADRKTRTKLSKHRPDDFIIIQKMMNRMLAKSQCVPRFPKSFRSVCHNSIKSGLLL